MKITIRGKSERISNKDIRYALRFFSSHIFRRSPKVEVRVYFKEMKHMAECAPDANPAIFHITLNANASAFKTRRALAHEIVHVRQFMTGDLFDYERFPDMVKWKGERVVFSEKDDEKYYLSPWEVEANGYEYGLCKLYSKERRRLARNRRRAELPL